VSAQIVEGDQHAATAVKNATYTICRRKAPLSLCPFSAGSVETRAASIRRSPRDCPRSRHIATDDLDAMMPLEPSDLECRPAMTRYCSASRVKARGSISRVLTYNDNGRDPNSPRRRDIADGALFKPFLLFPVDATPVAVSMTGIETACPFNALLARRRAEMAGFQDHRR
jgi:hypothetical protein